jgi:type I restriction enzyme, S subunit
METSDQEGDFSEPPQEDTDIPEGWAFASLPGLIGPRGVFTDGDWVESKDQNPNGDVRLIQLADIGDGYYKNKSSRFLTYEKALELGCTFLQPGDVLVARLPEPLGRACIFPGDSKRAVTAVDICIVRPDLYGPEPRWIMHALNSPTSRRVIESLHRGTTRKRISRKNLASIKLPVAPPLEQKRIVAKIEELLARVNEARERLARVPTILKRLRQAILAAACSGRLTQDWRERDAGIQPASVKLEKVLLARRANMKMRHREALMPDGDLPELDKNWVWATVDQLTAPEPNAITDGPFGSNLKTSHYTNKGPRVIRLQNIGQGVFIDEKAHISEEHFKKLSKHRIFGGDVAIATLGDPIPRAGIIPADVGPAIVKADVIRFKPNPELCEPGYICYALNDEATQMRLAERVHGVSRPRLNLAEVKSIAIPLPPLEEQAEIVQRVEKLFALSNAAEKRQTNAIKRVESISETVLDKAFSGELVPSEGEIARREGRSFESAGDLLERIRKERPSPTEIARKEGVMAMTRRTKASKPSERRQLIAVLADARKRMTPDDLFAQAGFDENSVEDFYEELRAAIAAGKIAEKRPSDTEVYLEATAS